GAAFSHLSEFAPPPTPMVDHLVASNPFDDDFGPPSRSGGGGGPAQGAVEVAMVDPVEWEEVWDSWAALVDLEAASLADDPLSVHQRQILDHTTRLDSGACRGLEVVEAEVVVEEDFHQEARPSLTCHPISAHPCTLGRVSIRCCHLEEWVAAQGVGEVHHIQGLGCLNSNLHMDKVGIPSTARPYLVALALVGLRMAP
ncbi:hypothetical protein M9458_038607, partial [Cirrhinus mrigala]